MPNRPRGDKGATPLISITRKDLGALKGLNYNQISQQIYREKLLNSSKLWDRFWELVEYLESKGLRPTLSPT